MKPDVPEKDGLSVALAWHWLVQVFGWLLVFAVFAVTLLMVGRLWGVVGLSGVLPNQNPPGTASPTDVMTALGTGIAVLTLVMTFGVPWLYKQIETVRRVAARADRLVASASEVKQQLESVQRLQSDWIAAHAAAIHWLNQGGRPSGLTAQLIGLKLQALMSDDEMTRRDGFAYLERLPWPKLHWLDANISGPLWRYQYACHRHHALAQGVPRAWVKTHTGIWCLFWDPIERLRFLQTAPPQVPCAAEDIPPLPVR